MLLLTGLAVLAVAAPAEAGYYLTRGEAQRFMRREMRGRGYTHATASCRPQGLNAPEPGYVYHRWLCGWAAGDDWEEPDCWGRSMIYGSRDGGYWVRDLRKRGICQYG